LWINNGEKTNSKESYQKVSVFLVFGSSYLVLFFFVLFGLGWDHDGWGIQSRYVAPGMLFIILGWFEWAKFNPDDFQKIKVLMLISSTIVLLYTGFFQSLIDHFKVNGAIL
jgi:hypothetical protein